MISRSLIAWTLGLVGLGILVYRPWQQIPFDITDFSETLPVLTGTASSMGRLKGLVTYYLGHGRANFLTSVLTWSHWEVFGFWATGWRLFRVLLFGVLIWTFLQTARRFGLTPFAAGCGACLFVLSRPAADGWLRFTGEPLAATFFLAALGVAALYHRSASRFRTSLMLACLSAAMILTKETMVGCVPLVFVVATSWKGAGGFRIPKLDSSTLIVGAMLGTTAVILGAMILLVSHGSGPEAYARAYGAGPANLAHFQYNALAITWPLGEPSQFYSGFGVVSSVVVLSGCLLAIHRGPARSVLTVVVFLLLIAFVGATVYLPWRKFEAFYAIPFLAAPGGLLAVAVRGLIGESRLRAALSTLIVGLMLVPPCVAADEATSVRAAVRVVNWEIARAISAHTDADSLLFATPFLADQPWMGLGLKLTRYANAVFGGGRIPPSADETCEAARDRLEETPTRREIVVSYQQWCGALPGADLTISTQFRSWLFAPVIVRRGRIAADIFFRNPPADARTPEIGM